MCGRIQHYNEDIHFKHFILKGKLHTHHLEGTSTQISSQPAHIQFVIFTNKNITVKEYRHYIRME